MIKWWVTNAGTFGCVRKIEASQLMVDLHLSLCEPILSLTRWPHTRFCHMLHWYYTFTDWCHLKLTKSWKKKLTKRNEGYIHGCDFLTLFSFVMCLFCFFFVLIQLFFSFSSYYIIVIYLLHLLIFLCIFIKEKLKSHIDYKYNQFCLYKTWRVLALQIIFTL